MSREVPWPGFEPGRLAALPPQDSVSTSSTTRAGARQPNLQESEGSSAASAYCARTLLSAKMGRMGILLGVAAVVGLVAGWLLGARYGLRLFRARRADALAPRQRSTLEAGFADVINLLNNRLAAIAELADLIRRDALASDDQKALDDMRVEVRHAAGIVRDMIHLVQPAGRGDESTYLPTALRVALERQRDELEQLRIDVALEVDASVALVSGRQPEIVNLFARLLQFASVRLKDAPAPRRVTWTARTFGAGVVVGQVDSGPALPPDFATVKLDYFGPANSLFLGHGELALAQQLAENCGAGLAVGGAPERGAEVKVTLIPRSLFRPAPIQRTQPRITHGSILVAEDDAANRRALTELLHRQGHEVVQATDGVEALRALERSAFDVILVDLHMPNLGGQELYERVRASAPEIARRFVFVTGDDVRAQSHAFLQSTAQPAIHKPFEVSELLAAMGEAAARG
jgi:CheY-like chemotaxis protein